VKQIFPAENSSHCFPIIVRTYATLLVRTECYKRGVKIPGGEGAGLSSGSNPAMHEFFHRDVRILYFFIPLSRRIFTWSWTNAARTHKKGAATEAAPITNPSFLKHSPIQKHVELEQSAQGHIRAVNYVRGPTVFIRRVAYALEARNKDHSHRCDARDGLRIVSGAAA
jgi:hypothetical protein